MTVIGRHPSTVELVPTPPPVLEPAGLITVSPFVFRLVVLASVLVRPMFAVALWLHRNLTDAGPQSLWGNPRPKQIRDMFRKAGAYFFHGELGSGKTMGALVCGLVLAAELVKEYDPTNPKHEGGPDVIVFVNLSVYPHFAALYLLALGYPASVVARVKLHSYSLMSPAVFQLLRRRRCVVIADEIGYYMEEDKKAVRSVILKRLRMARRLGQFWICVNQELLHSRYRPLFYLRGRCSMRFGLMTIAFNGAQDRVDSKHPVRPLGYIRYGLNVRLIGAMYDTWEDLEDISDEENLIEERRAA